MCESYEALSLWSRTSCVLPERRSVGGVHATYSLLAASCSNAPSLFCRPSREQTPAYRLGRPQVPADYGRQPRPSSNNPLRFCPSLLESKMWSAGDQARSNLTVAPLRTAPKSAALSPMWAKTLTRLAALGSWFWLAGVGPQKMQTALPGGQYATEPTSITSRASSSSSSSTGTLKYSSSPQRLDRPSIGSAFQIAVAVAVSARVATQVTPPALMRIMRPAMPLHLRRVTHSITATMFGMGVFSKLQLKAEQRVVVEGLPAGVDLELDQAQVQSDAATADAVILFVASAAELRERSADVVQAAKRDALAWVAYPKAGRLGTDLNRDSLARLMMDAGVQPVRQVAINDVWSALRFRPGA